MTVRINSGLLSCGDAFSPPRRHRPIRVRLCRQCGMDDLEDRQVHRVQVAGF